MNIKQISVDLSLAAVAVATGMFIGNFYTQHTHDAHIKFVDSYLVAQACKNLGPPTESQHPLNGHLDHAFACPGGAFIVIVK